MFKWPQIFFLCCCTHTWANSKRFWWRYSILCRHKPIFYKDYIYITSRYLLCSSCKTSIRILKKIELIDCQLFVPKKTSHKILEFLKVVDLVGNAHVRILSDASFNFDSFWKHVKRGLNPCCFLLVLVIECTYVLYYIYLTNFFNVSRD